MLHPLNLHEYYYLPEGLSRSPNTLVAGSLEAHLHDIFAMKQELKGLFGDDLRQCCALPVLVSRTDEVLARIFSDDYSHSLATKEQQLVALGVFWPETFVVPVLNLSPDAAMRVIRATTDYSVREQCWLLNAANPLAGKILQDYVATSAGQYPAREQRLFDRLYVANALVWREPGFLRPNTQ